MEEGLGGLVSRLSSGLRNRPRHINFINSRAQ